MLRFILKRTYHNEIVEEHLVEHKTLDIDVPNLEKILLSGGSGEGGYDYTVLLGIEVIKGE
jgi:hypothetical protein